MLHVAVLLLVAPLQPSLAPPVPDAPLIYAGPTWQAWQKKKAIRVRTHEGKLARDFTVPKRHRFALVLGDGTIVTRGPGDRFLSLHRANGQREDKSPFVWRKPTRIRAVYRDGIIVQPENEGVGHLFFMPWKRGVLDADKRICLTLREAIVDPAPAVFRSGSVVAARGWTFDLATKERKTLTTPTRRDALFDATRFEEASKGIRLHDGKLYALVEDDSVHLVVDGDKRIADFRMPKGSIKTLVRGTNTVSFKPASTRGWRHVYWFGNTMRYWDGKSWPSVSQAERKSQ
ncbi:MAG: hypothetical protein AAGD14_07620 [Planctomycetota bacterium]